MVFDYRWGQLPYMLDALTELIRQINSANKSADPPYSSHEADVVRATSMAAEALADLQVIIGRQYVGKVDETAAAGWRAAVQHLRAAAQGLQDVPAQLRPH